MLQRIIPCGRIKYPLHCKLLRHLSSGTTLQQHVNVRHNEESGYSIIEMNKGPVNSMSLEFMEELTQAIRDVHDTASRGIIISSTTKAFSAGLDLNELVRPDPDRLLRFWSAFQQLHITTYTSPLVTIAAVNGAAIAGGCALSLCCDYRIIAEGRGKIGLNTVHTGLIAPYWVDRLYMMTLGHRTAEKFLCLGHLLGPGESLERGLVDEVVEGELLVKRCGEVMADWLSVPDVGRRRTKELMRADFVEEFHRIRDRDTEMFTGIVMSDAFQDHILKYVDSLKKK